jgi:hypothetical protein
MDTHLRRRSLVLARTIWVVLVLLTFSLFIASIQPHFSQLMAVSDEPQMWLQISPVQEHALLNLGLSVRSYAVYMLALQMIVVAGFFGLSLLIFWRRSDDGMAIFVSLVSILYGVTSVPIGQALAQQTLPAWRMPVDLMNSIGWGTGLVLFYLFPDGRWVPRWTRWLAALVTIWVWVWPFLPALNPDQWTFPWPFLTKTGWYATGVVAQLFRYLRHSTPVERQQTKWAVFGFTAAFTGFILFNLPVVLWSSLQVGGLSRLLYLLIGYPTLGLLPLLLAPLSLGFACLRYRLWDIDLVINRTMILSVITTVLASIYLACVLALQGLFLTLTGQGRSEIATAVSTLVIWAAFQPVQRRAQALIDRLFFRRRYEAEQTLTAFSATMRDQVDLNQVTERLATVVQETVQPAHVSLWLIQRRDRARSEPDR